MLTRPAYLLRMEDLALLAGALALYAQMHLGWVLFAVLFLVPDLFMLGYLSSPRVGAAVYNLGHFMVLPIAAFAVGYATGRGGWMAVGLIWFSHIAFNRILGFGLKYAGAFKDTHIQHLD